MTNGFQNSKNERAQWSHFLSKNRHCLYSRIFLKNEKHHIVIFDNGMLKIKVPFHSYF